MQPNAQRRGGKHKPRRPADDTAECTAIHCIIVTSNAQSVTVDTFGRVPQRVTLPWGQITPIPGGLSLPEWLARDKGLI